MNKIILTILICAPIWVFAQAKETFEYVYIADSYGKIKAKYSDRMEFFEYKKKKIMDYSPLLFYVEKFESEGWTLLNFDLESVGTGGLVMGAIMRRKRE